MSENAGAVLFVTSILLLHICQPPIPPPEPTGKEVRYKKLLPRLTMNKVMYDNIAMHASSGRFVCTISLKKANWYLKKNIATSHSLENPLKKITLLFEPDKSETQDKTPTELQFQQRVKHNICVVW